MIDALKLVPAGLVLLAAALVAPANALGEGDVARGELLAYTCLGCHGIAGYRNAYPSYRVPKLGGQKAGYIELSLKAYRAGTRPHPTMQAQGTSLSDQDIADLAAYFQGAEKKLDHVSSEDIAGIDAAATCLACHGNAAEGLMPTPPTLSGQYPSYLEHALKQYRSGARANNIMNGFAAALSDEDIARIAEVWSRQEGLYTPDPGE